MPKKLHFDYNDPNVSKILKKVDTFNDLTDAEIKSLAHILKKQQYDPDELVFREGDIGSTAYVVAEGKFHLEIMSCGVKSFYEGDFFGEIALVDKRSRMGTVRAVNKAKLFVIEMDDLSNEKLIASPVREKNLSRFCQIHLILPS